MSTSNMNRPPRSRAKDHYEYRRAYKACIPCRQRKVKCRPTDRGSRPCSRCKSMGLECSFTEKLPWSREKQSSEPTRVSDATSKYSLQQQNFLLPTQDVPCIINGNSARSTAILKQPVSSSSDALDILFKAAHSEPGITTPAIAGSETPQQKRHTEVPNPEAIRIWNACRFVKMGWFTANEAIDLVNLFFQNMSPLSPILTDFYASSKNHYWLVTQEPMLCTTILMISSRHHILSGPGVSSRAYSVHHRLWQHCQHLILRIVLGQEKVSKAKTRRIGTIEALLLISEWYPRAVHFPPETDGWDSDLIMTAPDFRDPPGMDDELPMSQRWKEDVVEPSRRLDRMSWMLINTALGLAHELGVFAPKGLQGGRVQNGTVNPDAEAYLGHLEQRSQRLPILLFLFTDLLASRIGCTSSMPADLNNISYHGEDADWVCFMESWTELTKSTRSITNQYLLPSEKDSEGRLGDLSYLRETKVWLSQHEDDLLKFQGETIGPFNDIYYIEFHYLRAFISSIGMQACLEKVTEDEKFGETTSAVKCLTKQLQTNHEDREMIEDTVTSSSLILSRTIEMSQRMSIQHLPIRVFLRIISSSIFLLKALVLGSRIAEAYTSLDLLDKTIVMLQSSSLEDLHLVSRYAELLHVHVSQLRLSFDTLSSTNEQESTGTRTYEHDSAASDYHSHLLSQGSRHQGNQLTTQSQQIKQDGPLTAEGNNIAPDEWLGFPLDPLMAPFGTWQSTGDNLLDGSSYGLDPMHLDLDFIWDLHP